MMLLIYLNTVLHFVGFCGMLCLIIAVFGRPNSVVHSWPKPAALVLKVVMALIAGGHFGLGICMCPPRIAEVIMTAGAAGMWIWVSWYHWLIFHSTGHRQPRISKTIRPDPDQIYTNSVGHDLAK